MAVQEEMAVIPLVEERLVLVEEIHVRKTSAARNERVAMAVRTESASIERDGRSEADPGNAEAS